MCFYITDLSLADLRRCQQERIRHAFRPGTVSNQQTQIRAFIQFCKNYGLSDLQPSVDTLTLYIEFLARKFKSPKSVRNYLSAVLLMHKQLNMDCPAAHSYPVSLMLRAIDHSMRHTPTSRLPVTVTLLQQLCSLCSTMGIWGCVLKCAMLLSFYSFFRQSNLAPPTPHQFDYTRHTTRGDVQQSPTGITIALKWTKTLQAAMVHVHIPLPSITGSPLCPVRAFNSMVQGVPTNNPRAPLLLLPSPSGGYTIVTIPHLTSGFNTLITRLHLPPHKYSFHSLRRGGATLAHQSGVPLSIIKSHGTWTSDAVNTYIQPAASPTSTLPRLLAQAVSQSTTQSPHP